MGCKTVLLTNHASVVYCTVDLHGADLHAGTIKSVTRGHSIARPTVTFPALEHHCCLTVFSDSCFYTIDLYVVDMLVQEPPLCTRSLQCIRPSSVTALVRRRLKKFSSLTVTITCLDWTGKCSVITGSAVVLLL